MMPLEALNRYINDAKERLNLFSQGKLNYGSEEQKKIDEIISQAKCTVCGKDLVLTDGCAINYQNNVVTATLEFICGHGAIIVHVEEKVKAWESIKGKMRTGNNKPHFTFLSKNEPGKNSKSVDGVSTSWTADRKNNKWKHIIKDIKTGRILHDEDIPLDQHK